MCQLSLNLGASTSWNPQDLSRPATEIALSLLLPVGKRNFESENVSDECKNYPLCLFCMALYASAKSVQYLSS